MQCAFGGTQRPRQDLSELGGNGTARMRIRLVHAEDVFVLDREIDIRQRDLGRVLVEFEAAGAARHRLHQIGLFQFGHQPADDHRIGVHALRNQRRANRPLALEPGEDAHGVDGNDESAAGQHNGNSESYIGTEAPKVK